ncbi:MAG TPA: hypothetical protein VKB80_26585 [Kofleriaceae bacterium]|nr:hypothetical protein [Kofleriaceae bacterium]
MALAMVPAVAHLMELPAKLHMARADYLTVQQIYRGWWLAGIVVALALVSTVALCVLLRGRGLPFAAAVVAAAAVAATQVVFWRWTFPATQATSNWTVLPDRWLALRRQWELAHATSAALSLIALLAVIASVVTAHGRPSGAHDRHPPGQHAAPSLRATDSER